jgi:putative flavoprotein involved in K+ transport
VWNQRYDEIEELARARKLPSPQLVGTPERSTLDLNALTAMGVRLVGRLAAVRDGRALFSGGLRNLFALADLKMERLLDTFDAWAKHEHRHEDIRLRQRLRRDRLKVRSDWGEPERYEPTRVPDSSPLQIDLRSGEIRSIVWCTGFRPDYSWLHVPVLDDKGYLRHDGGVVTDSPGLYALGLPVLRRRKSTFIHGIEDDAREVIAHLAGYLGGRAA